MRDLIKHYIFIVETMWTKRFQLSGAEAACWAHNPKVGRSKLPSAIEKYFWKKRREEERKERKKEKKGKGGERERKTVSSPKIFGKEFTTRASLPPAPSPSVRVWNAKED